MRSVRATLGVHVGWLGDRRPRRLPLILLSPILLAVLLLGTGPARVSRAEVIHVPADQPSVQAGIDAADHGDTVLVAPDVYFENLRFHGKRILVTSYLDGVWDRRHPQETILDGSWPTHPDTAAVVCFLDGEDSTSVLRGFTIRGGAGLLLGGRRCGGGICCDRASPTVEGNLIVGNAAHCGGGVHYCDAAGRQLQLLGNEIRWNAAANFGGGLWIPRSFGPAGSALRCEGNLIEGNTAGYGGALAIQYGQDHRVELASNILRDNFATHAGGIWCDKGHTQFWLERNLFAGNEDAALIVADYDPGSRVLLLNNTIVGNGSGVEIWHAAAIEIRNNIIVTNAVGIHLQTVGEYAIAYNDVWGNHDGDYLGCGPGWGDISDDPFFVGGIPCDYHLTGESPCIDAGDPESPPDPDGTRADMGAYPYDQGGPAGCAPALRVPCRPLALSVQPTFLAAGGRVQIAWNLERTRSDFTLEICDPSGRCLRCLHRGPAGAGTHQLCWNGDTASGPPACTGIYWVRAVSEGATEARRLIIMR